MRAMKIADEHDVQMSKSISTTQTRGSLDGGTVV